MYNDVHPGLAGFVCGPESPVAWVAAVREAWREFYELFPGVASRAGVGGVREGDLGGEGHCVLCVRCHAGEHGCCGPCRWKGFLGHVGSVDGVGEWQAGVDSSVQGGEIRGGLLDCNHGDAEVACERGSSVGRDGSVAGGSDGRTQSVPRAEPVQSGRGLRKVRRARRRKGGAPLVANDVARVGFWNSCSESVRQDLIDSKAAMHVAENKRRAAEAADKVAYLRSEQAVVDKVVAVLKKKKTYAAEVGDTPVAEWVEQVTDGSVRSLSSTVVSVDCAQSELASASRRHESEMKDVEESYQAQVSALVSEVEQLRVQLVSVQRKSVDGRMIRQGLRPPGMVKPRLAQREGESGQDFFLRVQRMNRQWDSLVDVDDQSAY